MKLKKFLLFIVSFLFIFILTNNNYKVVSADMGPKPSVTITISNLGSEKCYATLLSASMTTGPYSVYNPSEYDDDRLENLGEREIVEKFINYKDGDDFYFLCFQVELSEDSKSLCWSYYPPTTFKLLLYFPEQDLFMSSGVYERYAFDSYFQVDIKNLNDNLLLLEKNYDYSAEIGSFIIRVFLTIIVEVGIAILFKIKSKKSLIILLATNAVTQVILNVFLNITAFHQSYIGYVFNYVLLEMLVTVIELAIYSFFIKDVSKKRILLYVIVSNVLSFMIGLALSFMIPGLF